MVNTVIQPTSSSNNKDFTINNAIEKPNESILKNFNKNLQTINKPLLSLINSKTPSEKQLNTAKHFNYLTT